MKNPSQIEVFLQDVKISKIYVLFLSVNNTSYLKDKWETEIGSTITPEIWEQACEKAHEVSSLISGGSLDEKWLQDIL